MRQLFFIAWIGMALISQGHAQENYQITRHFPTESEMDKGDFTIMIPKQMEIAGDRIYVMDQGEHSIHIFDLEGNYQGNFGGYGEGPGEMMWPHAMAIRETEIHVIDQRNIHHSFDLSGDYLRRQNLIGFIYRFVPTSEGFFAHTLNKRTANTFQVFDQSLKTYSGIRDQFTSTYQKPFQDNSLTLKYKDGLIYCLQRYGSGLRVYHESGELMHRATLQSTPLDEETYRDIGYLYTYITFDVYKNHFVANHVAAGQLKLHVFDADATLKKRLSMPITSDLIRKGELISIRDMSIIEDDGEVFIYALLFEPVGSILKVKVNPSWLLPKETAKGTM